MSDFPKLRTGAVLQYPAKRRLINRTQTFRYLDGAEQRYAEWGQTKRTWRIELQLLTDDELRRLQDFFLELQTSAGSFRFTDPWDGDAYSGCTFADSRFVWRAEEEGRGRG